MANVQIEGSSRMGREEFLSALPTKPYKSMDECEVMTLRSECSILREWAAHKLLFQCHILRSHTESVDLNYPQRWYIRLGYLIVGGIALIFYR